MVEKINAKEVAYSIIRSNDNSAPPFPYLRDNLGDKRMTCISPHHGRSFVVSEQDGRYIVSKGNGLSYTQYTHLNSREFGDNTWGLLLEDDAVKDFDIGIEVHDLGIKTNIMQYVIKLETEIRLTTGHILSPILLQYSVECPYRICDAAYMSKDEIWKQVAMWERYNKKGYSQSYLIAAEVLINNLKILHENKILHNAIHPQNYTWALELLDFEISCSPKRPYKKDSHLVADLYPREIIQTYDIINHIASCLNESIDHAVLEDLFLQYGFDIKHCNSIYAYA